MARRSRSWLAIVSVAFMRLENMRRWACLASVHEFKVEAGTRGKLVTVTRGGVGALGGWGVGGKLSLCGSGMQAIVRWE
jgi:hypothetical protein